MGFQTIPDLYYSAMQHSNTKVDVLLIHFWFTFSELNVEYLKYGDKTMQMIDIKLTCSMFQVYYSL